MCAVSDLEVFGAVKVKWYKYTPFRRGHFSWIYMSNGASNRRQTRAAPF